MTAVQDGRRPRPWMRHAPVPGMFALLVVAVVLAVLSTNVQSEHTYRVAHECNGKLPLPTSAFAYAWAALALGVVAVALAAWLVIAAGQASRAGTIVRGGGIAPFLLTLTILALLFEVFVLVTAFQEAMPIPGPCSG